MSDLLLPPSNLVSQLGTMKRRFLMALGCGGGFAAAHTLSEIAAWYVYFYVFGHWHATTDNLWELDRFQFSLRIETFMGVLGGSIVFLAIVVRRLALGYRAVSLFLLAAGLGIIVDLIPWWLDTLSKLNDIFALALIFALSCVSAVVVASVANNQIKSASAAT